MRLRVTTEYAKHLKIVSVVIYWDLTPCVASIKDLPYCRLQDSLRAALHTADKQNHAQRQQAK